MLKAFFSFVPLNVVNPASFFEGEVPQGTNILFDYNNDQLNPQKRKASILGRAHDTKAGSSYAVGGGDPSTPPPKKKSKLIFDLNELVETWRLPIEEVTEIMLEYNVVVRQKKSKKRRTYVCQTSSSSCFR